MIQRFFKRLESKPLNLLGTRLFLLCLGLAILCKTVSLAPLLGNLYVLGEDTGQATIILYIAWGIAALGLITLRFLRFSVLTAYLCYVIDKLGYIQNAGDVLAGITLFFALFLDEGLLRNTQSTKVKTFLHNLAVMAIITQLCIVYGSTSLWKILGPSPNIWLEGTSLYYVTQLQLYSTPFMRPVFTLPLLTFVATYTTLAFQLLFLPLLFTRLHLAWVILGVLIHGSIAIFLGLLPFSLVLIGMLLITVSEKEWLYLAKIIKAKRFTRFISKY